MKAVLVEQPGSSEQLKVVEREIPKIKEGWSLVKIKGFGINRSEIFTRKGYSPSVVFPRVLGIECVGIIEETSDKNHFFHGQKVVSIMGEMGRAFDGSYAEYVLLPNEQIYPIKTNLTWDKLAAAPESYYTAYGAYKNLKLKKQDLVLVRAGASGVALAFLNLLKASLPEIKVTASVRSLAKKQQLLDSGYDEVIIDRDSCLQTKQKFDKVLDLIGPACIDDTLNHVADGGIICLVGLLGGQWTLDNFDPIMALQNNIYLTTFYSGNINLNKLQELFDFIAKYTVPIKVEKIFTIDHIKEAHDYLESPQAFGKVIVLNGDA